MTRNSTHCACRVPLDETVVPVFGPGTGAFAWLADHGVTDIGPDHLGRTSIPVAEAQRLYNEAEMRASIAEGARVEAMSAHAAAVAELRAAVADAFIAETGGEAVVSQGSGLLISVAERKAGQIAAGLGAARAVWLAAPFEVRVEVHQLDVTEGDVVMSYDLAVVLPRATLEDGIARAVARANRAAL
jgi:hypothetical protein